MATDPQKDADTQSWLVKAVRDLATAKLLLEHPEPLLDSSVYHCQQAAEKALKGYLFWHDIPFRRTHDLGELLSQCVTIDATLKSGYPCDAARHSKLNYAAVRDAPADTYEGERTASAYASISSMSWFQSGT